MNRSKSRLPRVNQRRRLTLSGFIRVAAPLTLGALSVMLGMMLLSGDPQLWQASGTLCLVTIAAIWIITISIGCFIMIPVGLWRISKRLSRGIAGKAGPDGRVWDRWMDGPEPLGP